MLDVKFIVNSSYPQKFKIYSNNLHVKPKRKNKRCRQIIIDKKKIQGGLMLINIFYLCIQILTLLLRSRLIFEYINFGLIITSTLKYDDVYT